MASGETDIVVTGIGPVSGLGVGRDAFFDALQQSRCVVDHKTLFTDVGHAVELPMVTVPADTLGLDKHLAFLESQESAQHRDLAYSLLAIELALKDAQLEYDRKQNEIGVIQAFEAPGTEALVARMFAMMQAGASQPPPDAASPPPGVYDHLAPSFYNTQAFYYVHLVGKAFGFHGFSTSVHNACTSGAYALELASERIRSGQADVMIVAGGEAFDTGVRLEWFRRMEMYSCDATMKPFHPKSNGFYVGEGAAAMVLESARHAEQRGATIYGRYLGGAFAQQSWKQVIPDIASYRLAEVIERGLKRAQRTADDVDVVVPHGACTRMSDGYEARCMQRIWTEPTTSCQAMVLKPYVGHMLAASGLMETLGALLALREEKVFATCHANEASELPMPLTNACCPQRIETLMKLSTGFTGHDAASVWARP